MSKWTKEKEEQLQYLRERVSYVFIFDHERRELQSLEREKTEAALLNSADDQKFTAKDLESAYYDGWHDCSHLNYGEPEDIDYAWGRSRTKKKTKNS